jgi:uncharacterized RDD family membrane protein YckC
VPPSEKLTIDTPEQIALEFPLASAGSRFLALAIDSLIQFGSIIALFLIAAATTSVVSRSATPWTFAVLLFAGFVVYYGYFAVFEAVWSGQTPGKRVFRLRVISTSGRPITVYESLLRNLVRIVDQIPGMYAVGLVTMFLTDRSQRLGDLAADTVVVAERPVDAGHIGSPSARPVGVHRGATRLSGEELAVIDTFLSRRHDVPAAVRAETAKAIAARVRRQLNIPVDDSTPDEALLEQVASEARH